MVSIADILAQNQGLRGASSGLNRRADYANLILQTGARGNNPLVALLAGAVGGGMLRNIAAEEENIGRQEQAVKDALLQRQAEIQDKELGFKEQQLGFEKARLGMSQQELALTAKLRDAQISALLQTSDRENQGQKVRRYLLKSLMGQEQQRPDSNFVGAMPKQRGLTTDPTQLTKAATLAAFAGDSDLAKTLTSVTKNIIDASGGGLKLKEKISSEGSLRDDYTQASKNFATIADSYGKIKISAQEPSGAGDISLIFSYMKMLDPASTVREGEFATAQNAGSIPESIIGKYNKAISGETFAPEVRADFVKRAKSLYKQSERQHSRITKTYENIAKRSGLDPKNVVIDYSVKMPKNVTADDFKILSSPEAQKLKGAGYNDDEIKEFLGGF